MEENMNLTNLTGLMEQLKGVKLQECCMNHCRDWRETIGGYPVSNHSPTCPNYKTESFFKITKVGEKYPFLILENKDQIKDWLGERLEQYNISKIELTRDQFENLKEFDGF